MPSTDQIVPKQRPSAKITQVEAIPLHLPLAQALKISTGGARQMLEVLIVRLHTDQGIIGIGETQAWRRQGGGEVLPNLTRMVRDHFAPLLVGRSVFDIAGTLKALSEAYANTLYAQAAVSDAMFDASGKALGQPVHKLLGGECRSSVRVGVILSIEETTDALLRSAQNFYDRGYRYFGLKIGIDLGRDVANAAALRERFGKDISLRVDANGALTRDAAIRVLRHLEPFDIDAAEQPVASWDIEGLAAVARATTIPVMADESLSTDHSLLDLIRRRAASAIHTKLAKNGGLYRTSKLWAMASAAGMRICPGNHPCTSVATAAASHLCAAWPEPLIDGVFAVGIDGALETDVVRDSVPIANGTLTVPTGPGLGVELDLGVCDRYRADRD